MGEENNLSAPDPEMPSSSSALPEELLIAEASTQPVPGPESSSSSGALPEDKRSLEEERHISESVRNDFIREQRWLEIKFWIKAVLAILVAFVGTVALLSLGTVLMAHHLAPDSWGWLSEDELNQIYRFTALVSGGGISVQVIKFIREIL